MDADFQNYLWKSAWICVQSEEWVMDSQTSEALGQFFSAQKKLNQLDIIRSRDYIGDVGRYLCQVMYGLKPAGRRAGYDGTIGASKVLVRINNCPTGTKVRLVEPLEFDEFVVVLGPNSLLRPEHIQGDFIFYRFTREEVLERFRTPRGNYIGGKEVFSQGHDRVLSLAAAVMRAEEG
jgi:hypothetical protein